MRATEATFGDLVAAGPRVGERAADYSFVFETVLEGYRLHYGDPRPELDDPDQRLIEGDLAYALGLARLAEVGDLEAVSELADLISLCAQVHVEGRGEPEAGGESLPAALWALCALAVGTGPWAGHRQVKEAVRARAPGVAPAALGEARDRAAAAGIGDDLNSALIAFRSMARAASRST
jgi:hypothetical protein